MWSDSPRTIKMRLRRAPVAGGNNEDATLSALALSDQDDRAIALTPIFASATTSYNASVANSIEQITVAPTTNHPNATVEYPDEHDTAITDADDMADWQQVSLDVGVNTIKVKVTAEDGNTTQTYTVTVRRFGAEIWRGTLSVQNLNNGDWGCANSHSGSRCTNSNHLDDDHFTHDSTDYDVTAARLQPDGRLQFWITPNLTTRTQSLVFHADSHVFAFEDADVKEARNRKWNNSGLSWSTGDTVELRLTASTAANNAATGTPGIIGTA